MLPENRVAAHPGEILREEFLGPDGITLTTPQFWMNLQNAYDLTGRRPDRTVERLIGAG